MNYQDDNLYGYIGWREFSETRQELLNEFDRSRGLNQSRPTKTEHGKAGEAAIRKWLSNLLPQRFGVTSGYVITDIITQDYTLYHYDVIIYDKLNSPVLWIDSDLDTSEQGKKRAIPAKYIYSIFEVKATFNKSACQEAIKKLNEINLVHSHLHKYFTCATIFFDLEERDIANTKILELVS